LILFLSEKQSSDYATATVLQQKSSLYHIKHYYGDIHTLYLRKKKIELDKNSVYLKIKSVKYISRFNEGHVKC